ncbi:unnamed protein product [Penicillium salamii]|nr:unnamed protein product [Penicillium salamii]CAG8354954.1 unnamed protein product [Penicillium salamii]
MRDELEWKRLRLRKKSRPQNDECKTFKNESLASRLRPLTPPLPEANDSIQTSSSRPWRLSRSKRQEQQTFDQNQSPLFNRLPAEVRLLIWEHYLSNQRLHMILSNQHTWKQSDSKIIGLSCSDSRDYCPCTHHCWGQRARRPAGGCVEVIKHVDSRWHEEHEWNFDTGRVDFVPLLQTCRAIYSESIDMMYQNNTFLFNNTSTIVDLSHTLLPQRMDLIRNVQLSFSDPGGPTWEACCQVLATRMPNLRNLIIHLYPHVTKFLDSWLLPLHQIQQASVFEVTLIKPWYLDPQWENSVGLVAAPFQFALVDTQARCVTFPNDQMRTE